MSLQFLPCIWICPIRRYGPARWISRSQADFTSRPCPCHWWSPPCSSPRYDGSPGLPTSRRFRRFVPLPISCRSLPNCSSSHCPPDTSTTCASNFASWPRSNRRPHVQITTFSRDRQQYVALINHQSRDSIVGFSYFQNVIEEV